jgi:hypothetical protein
MRSNKDEPSELHARLGGGENGVARTNFANPWFFSKVTRRNKCASRWCFDVPPCPQCPSPTRLKKSSKLILGPRRGNFLFPLAKIVHKCAPKRCYTLIKKYIYFVFFLSYYMKYFVQTSNLLLKNVLQFSAQFGITNFAPLSLIFNSAPKKLTPATCEWWV